VLCTVHFLLLPPEPSFTSNAFASRIDFTMVGATPASLNRPGLPATPGKLKKAEAPNRASAYLFKNIIYKKLTQQLA
jgi:hypothetical protein